MFLKKPCIRDFFFIKFYNAKGLAKERPFFRICKKYIEYWSKIA